MKKKLLLVMMTVLTVSFGTQVIWADNEVGVPTTSIVNGDIESTSDSGTESETEDESSAQEDTEFQLIGISIKLSDDGSTVSITPQFTSNVDNSSIKFRYQIYDLQKLVWTDLLEKNTYDPSCDWNPPILVMGKNMRRQLAMMFRKQSWETLLWIIVARSHGIQQLLCMDQYQIHCRRTLHMNI